MADGEILDVATGRRRTLGALAAMGGAMVSVQLGAALAKSLFPLVGPAGAVALRVGFSAVILLAAMRPWRGTPVPGARGALLAYGVSLGAMNLLFYAALDTLPLGIAVAVEFVGPLSVAILSSRRWIDLVWIALAAAGLLALLPLWRQAHRLDPVGLALALAAGACWGCYIVFGQRAGAAYGARATGWGMLVAALVACPIGLATTGSELVQPAVLPVAVAVAILSSVAPYTLEMFALARMPLRVFGTLMSVEPAIAAAMGAVFLREALTPLQLLAIAAIMAASIGATLTMREGDQG